MTTEDSKPPDDASEAAAQDLAWMERVKAGDLEAFRSLVEAHQHRVAGAVSKMLGGDSDSEDIAQQVFVRVWKSASRYEPSAKFTTWLYTIARNLVFNEIRRRKRHFTVSLDEPREAGTAARQMSDPSAKQPDEVAQNDEMQAAIQRAIDELPETQRMAVILRRYDDVPYEEIGKILKLSVPAVKSTLFRARTELREKLRRYLEG